MSMIPKSSGASKRASTTLLTNLKACATAYEPVVQPRRSVTERDRIFMSQRDLEQVRQRDSFQHRLLQPDSESLADIADDRREEAP